MDEKKIESRIRKGFALWKYSFQNHPMKHERKKYRYRYCRLLEQIVMQMTNDHKAYAQRFKKLRELFNLREKEMYLLPEDKSCRDLSGITFGHGRFIFGRRDHRMLLLIEAALLIWMNEDIVDVKLLESYARKLLMKDKEIEMMDSYISEIFEDENKIKKRISENKSISVNRALTYIREQRRSEYERIEKKQYRVAVCATMSSGKSTILNAMLCRDIIPYGNMACTAKIISLENDGDQEYLLGGRKEDDRIIYSYATAEMLDEWNNDKKANFIYLTGNISGIKSQKSILQLYDTPGVNYSRNAEHEILTKEFLRLTPLNLIIFVCNAEQLGTTSEADYLIWLKRNIIDKKGTKILFVVNKMDSLDSDNEDVKKLLHDIYKQLCTMGFIKPMLVPISASAACLFRKAIKNEKMTKKEFLKFKNNYHYFMDEKQDFRKLITFSYPTKVMTDLDESVEVNGIVYDKHDLFEAIERTGIPTLEEMLNKNIEEETR